LTASLRILEIAIWRALRRSTTRIVSPGAVDGTRKAIR